MLCNGEMDKVQLVSKDCLSVDDNLKTVHEMCWTKSSCSVYNDDGIARNWTGECEITALTRQDELTIQYRCGNISEYLSNHHQIKFVSLVLCDYWAATVMGSKCVDDNLILNDWANETELSNMKEADKKNKLLEKLNIHLNGDIHTIAELNSKQVSALYDSLCSLASMYRALVNSILTKSQLKKYDYSMMKRFLIDLTKHFATYIYTQYDSWKSKIWKDDHLLLHKIYEALCKNKIYISPNTKKKRSIVNEYPIIKRDIQIEETVQELEERSYGSRLGYECGLARQFVDPETEEFYPKRWLQCNWNKTWTKVDYLDTCTWIACINPPTVSTLNTLTKIIFYRFNFSHQPTLHY